jgi:hypothetical protein
MELMLSPFCRLIRSTPLVIDLPALVLKERGDPSIPITPIFVGQLDNAFHQTGLVVGDLENMPLGRPRLIQR